MSDDETRAIAEMLDELVNGKPDDYLYRMSEIAKEEMIKMFMRPSPLLGALKHRAGTVRG